MALMIQTILTLVRIVKNLLKNKDNCLDTENKKDKAVLFFKPPPMSNSRISFMRKESDIGDSELLLHFITLILSFNFLKLTNKIFYV